MNGQLHYITRRKEANIRVYGSACSFSNRMVERVHFLKVEFEIINN